MIATIGGIDITSIIVISAAMSIMTGTTAGMTMTEAIARAVTPRIRGHAPEAKSRAADPNVASGARHPRVRSGFRPAAIPVAERRPLGTRRNR